MPICVVVTRLDASEEELGSHHPSIDATNTNHEGSCIDMCCDSVVGTICGWFCTARNTDGDCAAVM